MKNTKIGLIGYGYWGKNLARNLVNLKVLKCIFDNDSSSINNAKKLYPDLIYHKNIDSILNSNIDAVFISSPASTHGNLVKLALKAKKNVFVEKPLCLNYAEGIELKKIAKENNLKLMVGHLLLYHPAFITLKEMVDSGIIGKIRYIYSNRLSLGKLRKEEDALWSFAPHDISMILALVGKEPIKVEATGGAYLSPNIADTSITFLSFVNNIKAHVFVSWLHPYKDQKLVVVGEKAMITFDDVANEGQKLILYEHKASWSEEIPIIHKAEGKSIQYDSNQEPLKLECQNFISWIEKDIIPPSNVEEGLRVLKVLNLAEKSLKKENL
jgi:UDP-2-acetamido-3-amino-2,3-dideoxy-glucuronate N-acetyltransferase